MDHAEHNPIDRSHLSGARVLVAVLVSVLVHVALWGSSQIINPTPSSSFKIAIDVRDGATLMDLGTSPPPPKPPPEMVGPQELVGAEPPPPPEPPPKPPEKPVAVAVKKPARKKKPKPVKAPKDKATKPPQPPARPDPDPNRRLGDAPAPVYVGEVPFEVRDIPSVRSIAPGNAVVSAIVDMRRARNSPYRAEIAALLKSYPDYHRVMGSRGQDPMEAYDRFLVATTNPRQISQTLLLGEVRQPEQLREELDRIAGETLTWTPSEGGVEIAQPDAVWWARRGDDPRVFVIPAKGVVALSRREQLPWFAARRRSGRFFPPMPPPIDTARGALPAAVVAEVRLVAGTYGTGVAARLPMPAGVSVALHDDRSPLIRASLSFGSKEEAEGFMTEWPGVQKALTDMLMIRVGPYRGLIQRIQARRDGDQVVYLEARGTPKETRSLLALLAHLIKNNTHYHHPRPGEVPEPEPEKIEPDEADGGLWAEEGDAKEEGGGLWGDDKEQPEEEAEATQPQPSLKKVSETLSGVRDALKRPDAPPKSGDGLFDEPSNGRPAEGDNQDAMNAEEATQRKDTIHGENASENAGKDTPGAESAREGNKKPVEVRQGSGEPDEGRSAAPDGDRGEGEQPD